MSSEQKSYAGILKATSLIGGSSMISILINMVKTKFVAVLLGPAGVGLMGIYTSITGMVSQVAGMGIATSGVRQIAAAHGGGDSETMAKTVRILRRTVWGTGLLGMAATMLGAPLFSKASFGTTQHVWPIAVLGISILLSNLMAGRRCILQGTRRIGHMAKMNVMGSLNGVLISIPCFYLWGIGGIVPALLLNAAAGLCVAWWYTRRIEVMPVRLSWKETGRGAFELLNFGVPLMLSGLVVTASAYVIRALLLRQIGIEAVGLWQAAFTLSSVLAGFVLKAMGADYYPRLVAVVEDNRRVRAEVNAQTEIALLLAVPALAATIIFAPLVITIFYSGEFDEAADVLRWSIYGVYGKVISWPLGFLLLAARRGKTFLATEIACRGLYVVLIWLLSRRWGLPGTGVAFMLLYFIYTPLIYGLAYIINRTTWSRSNLTHILGFGIVLGFFGLIGAWEVHPWFRYAMSIAVLGLLSLYCLRRLSHKSGITLERLLNRIGFRRSLHDKR